MGAIIGVGALIYAAQAFRVAKKTLDLGEEQRKLAQAQHDLERQQFQQQQLDRAARAAFRLSVDLVNADADSEGGVHTTDGNRTYVRLRIEIKNVGQRAAGTTMVNVLAPVRHQATLRWCDEGGREIADVPAAIPTPEEIGEGDNAGPAAYLYRQLDSVSLRTPVVLRVRLAVGPLSTLGEYELPVRVKAQADELPDDEFQETLDRVLRIRHRPS